MKNLSSLTYERNTNTINKRKRVNMSRLISSILTKYNLSLSHPEFDLFLQNVFNKIEYEFEYKT